MIVISEFMVSLRKVSGFNLQKLRSEDKTYHTTKSYDGLIIIGIWVSKV